MYSLNSNSGLRIKTRQTLERTPIAPITKPSIAVDNGDLAIRIGLNTIKTNGSVDAIDANASGGTDQWFLDQIGPTPGAALRQVKASKLAL
ncbi:MAG TPA: hypothetical protein VGR71_12915 [Nitrospira sp.]|nr:hypothetical protein [Nitrospira sp.]